MDEMLTRTMNWCNVSNHDTKEPKPNTSMSVISNIRPLYSCGSYSLIYNTHVPGNLLWIVPFFIDVATYFNILIHIVHFDMAMTIGDCRYTSFIIAYGRAPLEEVVERYKIFKILCGKIPPVQMKVHIYGF